MFTQILDQAMLFINRIIDHTIMFDLANNATWLNLNNLYILVLIFASAYLTFRMTMIDIFTLADEFSFNNWKSITRSLLITSFSAIALAIKCTVLWISYQNIMGVYFPNDIHFGLNIPLLVSALTIVGYDVYRSIPYLIEDTLQSLKAKWLVKLNAIKQ